MAPMNGARTFSTCKGANLNRYHVRHADARGITAVNVDLTQSAATDIRLQDATLSDSTLNSAKVEYASLLKADFTDSRLQFLRGSWFGADEGKFITAILFGTRFTEVSLKGADFTN